MASPPRVLVVPSEADGRSTLVEILENTGGMPVTTARENLPGRLGGEDLDLVVVELGADLDEGLELVRQARSAPSSVAVVAVVGEAHLPELERLLEAGADDVVCRPVREAELRARLLSHRRLRVALDDLRGREDQGRVMLELTRTLSSSLEFEDILFEVARRIAEVIHVDRCSIVLTGADRQRGYVVASSEDRGVRDLQIELAKYPEVQKVLEDGEALVIDVGTAAILDSVRDAMPSGWPSTSALFPITHESGPLGVLFLRFKARRDELTQRELSFCQTVANATAISLRNARIVNALRVEQARMSHAANEAERKAEALSHYADFFESSADGMLVVDHRGAVLYANPRISELTGRTLEAIAVAELAQLVVDDELGTVERLLDDFAGGVYPRGLDLRFEKVGAEPVVLSVAASSTVRIAQGVLLILRDVTAARATEAELRRTKEFLEGLIAQSVDAIIASDMQGRLVLFNPAAERVLAYSAEEVLGKPMIEQMYPPGVAREIMRKLRSEDFGGPGRLEQTRATIVAKDGTEVPISMTGGVIFEEGEPGATFGIFTDLRPMLEMENDLARTRLELMEREREAIAAQLAGAAAHELNQPLTSVMAAVDLLRRKLGSSLVEGDTLDHLMAETERMAQIVRQIGRITHYETKAYVGSTRILDLDRASGVENAPAVLSLPPREREEEEEEEEREDTFVGRPVGIEAIRAEEAAEPPAGAAADQLATDGGARTSPSDAAAKEGSPAPTVFRMEEDEEAEAGPPPGPQPLEEEAEDTHPTGLVTVSGAEQRPAGRARVSPEEDRAEGTEAGSKSPGPRAGAAEEDTEGTDAGLGLPRRPSRTADEQDEGTEAGRTAVPVGAAEPKETEEAAGEARGLEPSGEPSVQPDRPSPGGPDPEKAP